MQHDRLAEIRYVNVTDSIREHARSNPDAEAVIRPAGKTVSYRELDRTIDVIAAAIRSLGFGPGMIAGIKTTRRYRKMKEILRCRDLVVRLALDSMDCLELIVGLEAEFGVQIDPEHVALEDFRSVTSIAAVVWSAAPGGDAVAAVTGKHAPGPESGR